MNNNIKIGIITFIVGFLVGMALIHFTIAPEIKYIPTEVNNYKYEQLKIEYAILEDSLAQSEKRLLIKQKQRNEIIYIPLVRPTVITDSISRANIKRFYPSSP